MIEAPRLEIDRETAKLAFRKYKEHLHYSTPMDDEIRRIYQHIAAGRVVVKALEAIRLAGLNDAGYPNLAIVRADAKECFLRLARDGSAEFNMDAWRRSGATRRGINLPAGTFPGAGHRWDAKSVVPIIPIHLRPKRGIENYHILYEAEWTPVPPVDPLLLRRVGKGDTWLVVAAWDLTEVERAVLSSRIAS